MPPAFDAQREADRLIAWIAETTRTTFNREGAVVGVSGGVDSSTVLYLLASALGPERVVALILPDRDSSPDSANLALTMTNALGIEAKQMDLTAALAAMGCYDARDNAVKRAVPGFDPARDKAKIVLPQDLLGGATLNVYSVEVVKPDGEEIRRRLRPVAFHEIVAASNLKQCTRMLTLYHEAERRDYCVAGTANKDEYDLGFFVKYGAGGVDMQPISHLFKTQVYAIAEVVGVPAAVRQRPPTTDTYSAECTQEEFLYRLPFHLLDAIWEGGAASEPAAEIARRVGLNDEQVENTLVDIKRKQATTEYLRMEPLAPVK